jgi:hypothetical protein
VSLIVRESLRFFCAATILGGGGVIIVVESRLPLRPLSPEPLLEAPCECETESRLPLLLDSPLPLLGEVLAVTIVVVVVVFDSRRCHNLATSDLKSEMAV